MNKTNKKRIKRAVGAHVTAARWRSITSINAFQERSFEVKAWQVLMVPGGTADTLIERGAKTGDGTPMVDFLKKHDRSEVVFEFDARSWDAAQVVMRAVRAGWDFRCSVARRKKRKRKARS